MATRFESFVKKKDKVAASLAAAVQAARMDLEIAGKPKKIGRPPGKRTDPAFEQVSAWIRTDTYGKVRARLFEVENRKEFSVLVQELLEKWLVENPKKS